MGSEKDYQHLPNSSEHYCFGCSPVNPSGLQMKFFADRDTVFSNVTIPDHLCGWSNIAHGGVLTTILDEIMSWAALHFLKRITMTKSMKIEFIQPVYIRNPLKAEGKVLEQTGKHEADGRHPLQRQGRCLRKIQRHFCYFLTESRQEIRHSR